MILKVDSYGNYHLHAIILCMTFMYPTLKIFPLVTPTINLQVVDQIQNEGDLTLFTCQATGEPVPTISWYFNNTLLVDGMKHTISDTLVNTTTINSTITIMSVQSSDVGTYTCNATNVLSADTSSGILTVNGESLILIQLCIIW